ncbi:winged helix-turn-helix transcriptional regulator [Pseudomonas aeruginosa]
MDTTGLIDRKVVRFMSDASIYAFLSMEQAIADAGLSPEAYQNNPRVGLIAGSGGGSPRFQVFGADAMRGPRGLKAVGPHVEYSLTPLGEQVSEKVAALADWIELNLPEVLAVRDERAA